MLPRIAASISASVGLGFCFSSAAACIICPLWQYPHCGTLACRQACCTGCCAVALRPSMVTMSLPAALCIGVWQLRTAAPFTCTVHAPHSPAPQPYFVPVICSSSRRYQSSGISGSPSNWRLAPFTFSLIICVLPEHWDNTATVRELLLACGEPLSQGCDTVSFFDLVMLRFSDEAQSVHE